MWLVNVAGPPATLNEFSQHQLLKAVGASYLLRRFVKQAVFCSTTYLFSHYKLFNIKLDLKVPAISAQSFLKRLLWTAQIVMTLERA